MCWSNALKCCVAVLVHEMMHDFIWNKALKFSHLKWTECHSARYTVGPIRMAFLIKKFSFFRLQNKSPSSAKPSTIGLGSHINDSEFELFMTYSELLIFVHFVLIWLNFCKFYDFSWCNIVARAWYNDWYQLYGE